MKSKRVLTILLSMAIMLTFMPAMAFAAPANVNGHTWTKDASKSIEPTCQHAGLYVYSCPGVKIGETAEEQDVVLECEATSAEYMPALTSCTPKANPIQLSKADYLVRLATERGYTPEEIQALAESNAACYVFVKECKDCGRVIPDTEEWEGHKKPAGTPDCAISYVCDFCKQTVYTGIASGDNVHNYERKLYGENFCSDGSSASAGYTVYEYTCKDCGDTYRTFENASGMPDSPWWGTGAIGVKHEQLKKVVVKPATCLEPGEMAEECEVCGAIVYHRTYQGPAQPWNQNYTVDKDWVIPATDHNFQTISVPATCTTRAYTIDLCQNPGCSAFKHKGYSGDPLGHDYKVEVVFEPNCDAEGITMIYCTRCTAANDFAGHAYSVGTIEDVDKDGYVINAPTKDSKLYYVGLNHEFIDNRGKVTSGAIEVANWAMKAHDYGQYETLREADCLHGGYQAKKCSVCGHYDVHTAKQTGDAVGHQWITVTQEPTCGSKGFKYQVCKVCKAINEDFDIQYFGQPVVGYGEKCDFSEWLVETPATVFKEGTKKLICSVCKDDGHLTVMGGEAKEMGVTRTNIDKKKLASYITVKAGKKKATVTVKPVEDAVKYQIKVNGKVKKTINKPLAKAKKFTFKKLKGGKKAKIQLVVFNAKDEKVTATKSVKIKK